jgi:hypothetical protein
MSDRSTLTASNLYAPRALERCNIAIPDCGIVTSNDVSKGKPHPDPYLAGAQRCAVDPKNCACRQSCTHLSSSRSQCRPRGRGRSFWDQIRSCRRIQDVGRLHITHTPGDPRLGSKPGLHRQGLDKVRPSSLRPENQMTDATDGRVKARWMQGKLHIDMDESE